MVNPQLGTKRTCTTCGARFYDLNKTPIVCPKCGAENEKDVVKLKRGGKGSRSDAAKKAVVARPVVEDEDEVDETLLTDDDGDEGDLMEDTSDLGEDDDDMAEVIDHIESGDDDE
ncbi:TIGR02300 family protein [Insolitispirillum peregrinum]|uniref:TIGR02300 family protein n=1 Tax=Insolitispirillum peregrinum TaxID=80876 RepID=A0A1N7JCE8_9PROT|nr:TIGR02300 family protein [Insolitispirillum peregrinum]SIS46956.1 TIGR02300 family protein [Insolitispirillum peregrinum]